jgi:hypothetical protein
MRDTKCESSARTLEHRAERRANIVFHSRTDRASPSRSRSIDAWFRYAIVLSFSVLVVLASSRRAGAAAGQWQAGGRAGLAWLDGPRAGPSAETFLRHGITDDVDLDLQLTASLHPFQPDAKMALGSSDASSELPGVLGITPGLLYRWDVLRVVPSVGAAFGAFFGDGLSSRWNGAQFGVSTRAGVEYLLSRDVVLSVQASAHFALTESPIPSPWLQLTAGAGYVWGW